MRVLFPIHAYPPDVICGHEIRCQRTVEGLRVEPGARGPRMSEEPIRRPSAGSAWA